MAISPVVTNEATSDIKVTATKAKALAVRTNSLSNPQTVSRPELEKGRELAERLNDETKQRYVKDKKVGEGTYAIVYLGHLKADPSSLVAIKKMKVNTDYREGLSMDAIRESSIFKNFLTQTSSH